MFQEVPPTFAVGSRVQATRLAGGQQSRQHATVLNYQDGRYEIELADGRILAGTSDNLHVGPLISKEVRSRIAEHTYTKITKDVELQYPREQVRAATEGLYKNQSRLSVQIKTCALALHDTLQDAVCREIRPIHDAVRGLDVGAIANSVSAHATEAKEKAAVVDQIVEGLEGVAEISSQAQPILDQINNIARKLAEMENNQMRQLNDQLVQMQSHMQEQMQTQMQAHAHESKSQFEQLNHRLDKIESNATSCCSCTVM